jgi:hypothetical protein
MKNSCVGNPNGVHMLWCPLYTGKHFFEKNQTLNFWWNFKVLEQFFWTDSSSFGQILLHLQWLTTCPKFSLNL